VFGHRFPYVECAEAQFRNATRWDEPDQMAVHYGLKASPLSFARTSPIPKAMRQIAMLIIQYEPGHFSMEIPIV
jgi:hypothetical protein